MTKTDLKIMLRFLIGLAIVLTILTALSRCARADCNPPAEYDPTQAQCQHEANMRSLDAAPRGEAQDARQRHEDNRRHDRRTRP